MKLIKVENKITGVNSCDVCLVSVLSTSMFYNPEAKWLWEPRYYCKSCAVKFWNKELEVDLDYCKECNNSGLDLNKMDSCPHCKHGKL